MAEDGVTTEIRSLSWLTGNVFIAEMAGIAEKTGFELTAIDLPRTIRKEAEVIIGSIVNAINNSQWKGLKRDFFSRFPLEGYGDVVFGDSEESGCCQSLQQMLLEAGIGRIARPCYPNRSWLAAERRALENAPNSYAAKISRVEKSSTFYREITGTVVDVLKGDTFCVVTDIDGQGSEKNIVVMLMGVECSVTHRGLGFEARVFSQKFLFSPVLIHLHAFIPSDKDISNNTQETEYSQTEHYEGTIFTLDSASGEPRDIGALLLKEGLGKFRRCVDCFAPRPSNFARLLETIDEDIEQKKMTQMSVFAQWSSYMLYGDVLSNEKHNSHLYTPLKFLASYSELISRKLPLTGFATGFAPIEGKDLLSVQALIELPNEMLEEIRVARKRSSLGALVIRPDDSEVLGPCVDVDVKYDAHQTGIEESNVVILASCIAYPEDAYDEKLHKPQYSNFSSLSLRLPANSPPLLFVVDVKAQFATEPGTLRERRLYRLSQQGTSYLKNELTAMDEEEIDICVAEDRDEGPPPSLEEKAATHHSVVNFCFPCPASVSKKELQWILYKKANFNCSGRCIVNGRSMFYGEILVECGNGSHALSKTLPAIDSGDENILILKNAIAGATDSQADSSSGPATEIVFGCSRSFQDAESCRFLRVPALPSEVALLSFSVFPRMLFASHPKHHKSVIPESAQKKARGLAHLDAAFMRLKLPRLPNFFRCDLEQLPMQLRGQQIEDAVCMMRPTSRVLAEERCLSSLMAQVFSLLPREEPEAAEYTEVIDNIKLSTSRLHSTYLVSFNEEGVAMISSRKTFFEKELAVDESMSLSSLPIGIFSRIISAIAVHTLTRESDGDASLPNDYSHHVMGEHGLGVATADIPLCVYHPHPSFTVVADSLMERSESDPAARTLRCCLRYIPMRLPKRVQQLYRIPAYGQLARDTIYTNRIEHTRRGRELADYFSCMLRTTDGHGPADGCFSFFGNAHEPLYALYTPRRTMRWNIGLIWNIFRAGDQRTNDDLEGRVFEKIMTTISTLLELVQQNASRKCVLSLDAFIPEQLLVVNIFNISKEMEDSWQMEGTVLGRLPSSRVKLRWVGGEEWFKFEVEAKLRL